MLRKKNLFKKATAEESAFNVKAAIVTTVDVTAVSGTSNYGQTTNYTANITNLITEPAGAVIDAVLSSVSAPSGQSIAITTTLPVTAVSIIASNNAPTEGFVSTDALSPGAPANAPEETWSIPASSASVNTYSNSLTLITPQSALVPISLVMDVSSGGYTIRDTAGGILSADALLLSQISGTVDYNTGAWDVDFATFDPLTSGTAISANYDYTWYNLNYVLSGNLSLITPVSTLADQSLILSVSSGSYTFYESGGILTEASGLTGTVGTTDGNWAIDFNTGASAVNLVTNGTLASADYMYEYQWNNVTTPITIAHTIADGATLTTLTGKLSAKVTDTNGTASTVSDTFTLSANSVSRDNPWRGRGALPNETTAETRSRFYVEGVI